MFQNFAFANEALLIQQKKGCSIVTRSILIDFTLFLSLTARKRVHEVGLPSATTRPVRAEAAELRSWWDEPRKWLRIEAKSSM